MRVAGGRLASAAVIGRKPITVLRARSIVTTAEAPAGRFAHVQSGDTFTVSPPVNVKRPGSIVNTLARYDVGTGVGDGCGVAVSATAIAGAQRAITKAST